VTIPDAEPRTSTDLTARTRRDVVALVLIVLSVCGLFTVAWLADPLAFLALVCLAGLAGGIALGLDRSGGA
jgi:hypothetical protein